MAVDLVEQRRTLLQDLVRSQITEAFVDAALEKGYAGATIAEIVRGARVSKTTFYEHFADKEAVYLHLHRQVHEAVSAVLRTGADRRSPGESWDQSAGHVVEAYLETMAASPVFLGQVRIEPQVATPAALDARAVAGRDFADAIARFAAAADPNAPAPSPELVQAGLAGGLALISAAAASGPDAVLALRGPFTELWTRLLRP